MISDNAKNNWFHHVGYWFPVCNLGLLPYSVSFSSAHAGLHISTNN